jgi:hypothetical protein
MKRRRLYAFEFTKISRNEKLQNLDEICFAGEKRTLRRWALAH